MEVELQIANDGTPPPLSVLATAKVASISISVRSSLPSGYQPTIRFSGWMKVQGADEILRYFCCKGLVRNLYNRDDKAETKQIYGWLQFVYTRLSGSDFEGSCALADEHLLGRSFLVGDCLSLADVVLWSYLAGVGKRWESLMESKKCQNLVEWYNMMSKQYTLDEVRTTYLATYSERKDLGKPTSSKTTEKEQGVDRNKQQLPQVKKFLTNDLPDAEIGKLDEDEDLVYMLNTDAKEIAAVGDSSTGKV